MTNVASALSELNKLSDQERYELAMALLDGLPEEMQESVELSEEHEAILEERLAALEREPHKETPWAEVKKELEELCKP